MGKLVKECAVCHVEMSVLDPGCVCEWCMKREMLGLKWEAEAGLL